MCACAYHRDCQIDIITPVGDIEQLICLPTGYLSTAGTATKAQNK